MQTVVYTFETANPWITVVWLFGKGIHYERHLAANLQDMLYYDRNIIFYQQSITHRRTASLFKTCIHGICHIVVTLSVIRLIYWFYSWTCHWNGCTCLWIAVILAMFVHYRVSERGVFMVSSTHL